MKHSIKSTRLSCLVGIVFGIATSASAFTYTYGFSLNGAGANPPNDSPGLAFGTLTVTEPDILTLDITYMSLSSDLTQVNGWFYVGNGFGVNVEFYAEDLPPSGHWIDTQHVPLENILLSINAGLANLQVGTFNYPIGGFGEIGGYVNPTPIPEPSDFAIFSLCGILGLTWFAIRRPPSSQMIRPAEPLMGEGRRQPTD